MSSTFRKLGQSELLPRYIFAESLFARRRVLEIGAVASTLGQSARFLSTRGARIVVAADADLLAVQDAQSRLAGPNLRFRAPVFDDLDPGSFDLVIVADLAPYVHGPELLKDLVRLVAKNGFLMGGLRNPAGLALSNVMDPEGAEPPPTYGQLLDALSAHFRSIEVATQSPVLGYQLAFEKGEGLQVDGSLAGVSEAAYYVVLAGHEPVRFFDPTWVQLPPEPLAFTGGKLEDAAARARNWQERSDRLKDALTKSRDEITRRDTELTDIRGELEGSREAIARLTAQLESVRERPKETRAADELTSKVRRIDAELTVAKERASDAEGRVSSMRQEVELYKGEQKNATVETLAAQENARLERNRREQIATELEDARTRLTQAYEDLRRVQDDAAAQRVEAERARLAADRVSEQLAAKDRELDAAREKELRLAAARSESLSAIEGLQGDLKRAQAALGTAEEAVRLKEAEATAAIRSLDLEAQKHAGLSREAENARAKAKELQDDLAEKEASLGAAETELQGAKAAQARLQRDIETLANSERTWRETAQAYEQRLNDTLANVESLSEQVARLDSEKEQEVARFNRLERDLSTAVGAERSAREQAQATLADAQAKVRELTDDREQLLEQRDDLTAAVADLQKARSGDQSAIEGKAAQNAALEADLNAARVELANERERLEQQVLDLTDRRDVAEAALARAKDDLASAQEEIERTQGDVSEQLQASEEKVRELTRDRDKARTESAKLSGQLEQGRQRVAELAQRSARLETEAHSLRARVNEVEEQAKDRQERLTETQVKFTHAAKAAADAEEKVRAELAAREAELEDSKKQADAERTRLAEQLSQLEKAKGEAFTRAVDRERELETVRESLKATEAARQKLEGLLEADRREAAERRTELEAELRTSREQIERLSGRGDVLSNESKVLQHELDVQLGRNKELEQKLADQSAEADRVLFETKERAQRDLAEARDLADQQLQATEGAAQQRVSVLTQEIEAYKSDRHELEERLTTAQQHAEHMDAELAESAEVRADEAKLREKAEAERDAVRAELEAARADAVKANEWVVGGKSENEKLLAQVASATSDLERAREDTATQRKAAEDAQIELAATRDSVQTLQRVAEEKERERISLSDTLSRERAELSIFRQQVDASKADAARAEEQLKQLRDELKELQARFDEQLKSQRDDLESRAVAQQREALAAGEQLESLKKELSLVQSGLEKAQSEARGHQAGKLQLQKELDGLRGELTQTKASLAAVGGEAQSIAESRTQERAEREALQQRTQEAEGRAAKAEGKVSELESFIAQVQEQKKGLEAEVAAVKGAASGSTSEVEASIVARRTAEDLLVKMRARYAEIELQLQTELPALKEQLQEAQADNQMLDTERERLAAQVERLEATRTQGADAEKELKNRVDMLQRRVNAQDAELNALRRRAGVLQPSSAALKSPAASAVPPKPPATTPPGVVKGSLLDPEVPTAKKRVPLGLGILDRPPPTTKEPRPALKPPPPPKKDDDVELEVFELDLPENGDDDEELLLLEDEASDPGPGSGGKKP